MLKRLLLRDFVIVPALEVEFGPGFTVLTGETGAGKSILIDALQLALGARGEAIVVREGAPRAEIAAEFDAPASLTDWLDDAGFDRGGDTLLLRRTIDAQGKSRAWVNGSPATVTQLREAADALVDIHGQHAWQSLTRPAAVRALLDAEAGVDTATLTALWQRWRAAQAALDAARTRSADLARERERLAWQIGEVDRLAPGADEWGELNAEHQRLANAQALIDATRGALDAISEADTNADTLTQRAADALADVAPFDARLGPIVDVLQGAQAQLHDAAHSLSAYLQHTDLDPQRLAELDARLAAWIGLARRFRQPPDALPAQHQAWRDELAALDAASDLEALERASTAAERAWRDEALRISRARKQAAPAWAQAVTQAMQSLGMAGGMFEVALLPLDEPQSFGLESVELRVAGHAGSTPRALAKVASGGELSRLALAIAVTTARHHEGAGTLIFDEVDAGIGGAVADTVGRLMKQLGRDRQVLAVTHLAQVAACGDAHQVVSKAVAGNGRTASDVRPVTGEARTAEVARMLGGERLATSLAHAEQLLVQATAAPAPKRGRK
ncbi:MAG TPA: DNA repair protein RecN [Burkholderiaceae bacterium]|nr:DNA repair protein RecN [Burkholderiaceae bacterium]